MKKIVLFIFAIFICTVAFAQTINWHVGNSVYTTTTCSAGDSVTPPTPPVKSGYTFRGWVAYIPIEYLESTGTQYIDTGYFFNAGSAKIQAKVMPLRETFNALCGTQTQTVPVARSLYISSTFRATTADVAISPTQLYIPSTVNQIYDLIFYQNNEEHFASFSVNDTTKTHYYSENSSMITNLSLTLFSKNSPSQGGKNVEMGYYRVYYFKIYDNDVLVRDFIPVLDYNGVACMFDKVSRTFFYNAGTGDFIAGPVVSGE